MYSIEYIQNVLELNLTFYCTSKLKKKIQMIIGNNCISIYDNIRPQLPFILYVIDAGSKGN